MKGSVAELWGTLRGTAKIADLTQGTGEVRESDT
jgi:hypothetical protein